MIALKKRCAALLMALVLSLSLSVPALAAQTDDAAPSLEDTAVSAALAALEYGGATSVQYALWKDGEILLSGSSGVYSKSEDRALTDDILYGIGSVSKIYTTVAILQLAQQGDVSLDVPVTRYLPQFRMADPRYRDITVRMLLNHSSGLMGSGLAGAILFDDADDSAVDELLETLSTQRLVADPGAYSVYCNDGFTLAQLIVEAVSGQDFMEYVHEHILAPAGLEHTFAPGDDFDPDLLAKTYSGSDPRPLPQDCLNAVGAGGLYASASDLAAFGGALTDSTLLSASAREAMAAPEYDRGIWPDDTLDLLSYGLGWDCVSFFPFSQNDIQALVKGGDTLRYHAGLIVLPQHRMAAAVLSSGGSSAYNELAAARLLTEALRQDGVAVDETVPALPDAQAAAMPAELTALSGYYGSTTAQYRVDVSADGKLTLSYLNLPQMPAQVFSYYSDGTFRDEHNLSLLSFVTESNGETYLYQKALGALPGLGVLPMSNYAAVRMPENQVPQEVQSRWDTIAATSFLPLTEPYSSQVYLALSESAAQAVQAPQSVPGYMGSDRIVDAASARYEPQLPGTGGRDGYDITVREENGDTYMTAGATLYLAQEDAPELFTGSGWSYSTIQPDGYARWYRIGEDAAWTAMSVQVEGEGGFWVYNPEGYLTASSVLWGDTKAPLEEGGLVVFAGDAGSRFHLSFTR